MFYFPYLHNTMMLRMNPNIRRRLFQAFTSLQRQRQRQSWGSTTTTTTSSSSAIRPDWAFTSASLDLPRRRCFLLTDAVHFSSVSGATTTTITQRYNSQNENNDQSIEELEMNSMQQRATKLLAIPIGEMDTEAWFQADDLIKWWASQQTVHAVNTSFQILHRLVQELQVVPRQEEHAHHDDLITYFDGKSVIPSMIASWSAVYAQQVAKTQDGDLGGLELTPERLLQRMDRYAQQVPWAFAFRLHGNAISHLFNATLLRPKPYDQTAPFCDYLCNRLWEVLPRHSIMSNYMINTTLSLWSKSTRKDRVRRAEALFARACDHKVDMDIVSYNSLLSVYASDGKGQKAEQLLQALSRDHVQDAAPAPDEISFVTVATAHANSGEGLAAGERTAFLVQRLLDPFDEYGSLSIRVTNILFNVVLLAYARANDERAGDEAYRVLQEMKRSSLAPPDAISYGTVIDAYGRCGKPEMAEQVWSEQVDAFLETRDETIRPTNLSAAMLMMAYSKSKDPLRVERAMEILLNMYEWEKQGILLEGPDTWAYNVMLGCIKSLENPEDVVHRVESFFRFMKNRADKGDVKARPNSWTYSELVLLFMELNDMEKAEMYMQQGFEDPNVELDIRTVGRFIHTASKTRKIELVQKADFWLHVLLDRCEREKGKWGTRPSTSLLGGVVGAWNQYYAVDKELVVEKIPLLVDRYEQLYEAGFLTEPPDSRVYDTLIARLVRTGNVENRADRAIEILQRCRKNAMRHKKQMKRYMPSTLSYKNVIAFLADHGKADAAYELFLQMLGDFKANPRNYPMPDSISAAAVLRALSDAATLDSWDKATTIFRQLDDTGKTSEEETFLPIRDNLCYKAMVGLANKLSLTTEADELRKTLESREAEIRPKLAKKHEGRRNKSSRP